MSPERQDNWPKRHKKEIGVVAGGLAALVTGVLVSRGKLHVPEIKTRHPDVREIAHLLVDEKRGDSLPDINRMAALMSVIQKASKPEIVGLFGAQGSEASRCMAPLIQKRFVSFQRPPRSEGRTHAYVVNQNVLPDLIEIAEAEPEKYASFLNQRALWLDRLDIDTSGNS
jgi:hypothetical protein